ncbi:MAG: TetR/AcrR family transcriptional regulator [Promethearchaeota archaeon]
MNDDVRSSRARAPDKKAEQFNKILETGKELFVKYGSHGFSLRALARTLKMSQSNLYNYVKSKRELWIAIRIKNFTEFQDGFSKIVEKYKENYLELWIEMARYFLDFAAEDYKRFEMMFFVRAPPSEKIGEYEKKYKPLKIQDQGIDILNQSIKEKKFKGENPTEFFYYMYGACIGAAKIEADLRFNLSTMEPFTIEKNPLTISEFRNYFMKELRNRLEKEFV